MNFHDLIFFVMILFPISTILQGLPIMGNINRFLIVFLLVGATLLLFNLKKVKVKTTILIFLTFILTIISFCLLKGEKIYSINDILYFPSWIIIMLYSSIYYDEIKKRVVKNSTFIEKCLLIWNIIVLISFFFSSCYTNHWGEGRYFQSFSNAEHRFAASCFFVVVLTFLQIILTKKKRYYLLFLIPAIGIYLSGARTYLGIFLVLIFGYIYRISKNKLKFIFLSLCMFFLFLLILRVTPMWDKMLSTTQVESFRDPLATFTNGRSVFWNIQLSAFHKLGFFNYIFGAGYNFVYNVSNLWAHNDVINILLNFGYLGVFMYLYSYFNFIKTSSKIDKNKKLGTILMIIFIWFINAMLNMVYTYMCATLCIPFISILLGGSYESNN